MSKRTLNHTHDEHNTRIAAARVPAEALAECIALIRAGNFGGFPRSADTGPAMQVAARHGGDAVIAQAMHFRLVGLEMLMRADPPLNLISRSLSPAVLGAILSNLTITSDGSTLSFDGDALASSIRVAAAPVGSA